MTITKFKLGNCSSENDNKSRSIMKVNKRIKLRNVSKACGSINSSIKSALEGKENWNDADDDC